MSILISRTDSIGDVILTLPVAKILRDRFPGARIGFLGKEYTRAVIEACEYIDEFIYDEDFMAPTPSSVVGEWDAIIHVFPRRSIALRAKQLNIPLRIGTSSRIYHWWTCNKLVKLNRRHSDLHESQLNLKLLKPFGIDTDTRLSEICSWQLLGGVKPLPEKFSKYVLKDKYNLILHPKSQGSAREWGLDNFIELIRGLDKEKFNILISGTIKERVLIDRLFDACGNEVTDITGLMSLGEFISFIDHCDGLVANSTGPLHIAAALGKDALGIYPPIRPMHPGRWAPIGMKAKVFVLDKECSDCKKDSGGCICIKSVTAMSVKSYLSGLVK